MHIGEEFSLTMRNALGCEVLLKRYSIETQTHVVFLYLDLILFFFLHLSKEDWIQVKSGVIY